jgi:hypothetical protein
MAVWCHHPRVERADHVILPCLCKESACPYRKLGAPRSADGLVGQTASSIASNTSAAAELAARRCPPTGPGHGPYWYAFYWDYRQRTRSFYVGKSLPLGVELLDATTSPETHTQEDATPDHTP